MKTTARLALAALLLSTPALATNASRDVPPAAVLADLPMLSSLGVPVVVVDLAPKGHRPLRLMIDSGTAYSVMTPGYARRLGVMVETARARDAPYERPTVLGRHLHFRIDARLGEFESQAGIDFGLLGENFIHRYVLEMDFGTRRVRFIDPSRYAVPSSVSAPDEAVLPIQFAGVRPSVEVEVDGKPLRVLVDTGLPVQLVLSGASARHMGISHPLLAQFDVRIDYPHHRLWLRREKSRPPNWLDIFGLRAHGAGVDVTVGDEGILVEKVQPGSPAARLGLHKGDRIPLRSDVSEAERVADVLARIGRGEEIRVVHSANGVPVEGQPGEKRPGPPGP
jgi:hypothetical protein